MRTFRLNKLVRDKVFEDMVARGQQVKHKKLSDQELLEALRHKLLEEVKEFNVESKRPLKELADVQEVIDGLVQLLGATTEDLRKLQASMRTERGGFDQAIFVETVSMDNDDKWAEYYAKDPVRFPEE